jgi:DNA-binding GntR family transcriptional regulator
MATEERSLAALAALGDREGGRAAFDVPAGTGAGAMRRASRSSSIRAQVCATLRTAIVRVVLEPGQRLSEAELAAQLGVSRTPVRESVVQLVDEGLVDVLPQIGTFVSRISLPEVRQAQFVREAIECAALRVSVERLTDADIDKIRGVLRDQRAAQKADDFTAFQELDEDFHRLLMEATGHRGLWGITQRAKAHLDRARRLSLPVPAVVGELIDQHERIADLVAARDVDGAEAALRDHLRMVFRLLGPLQQEYPHYFVDTDETAPPGGDVGTGD